MDDKTHHDGGIAKKLSKLKYGEAEEIFNNAFGHNELFYLSLAEIGEKFLTLINQGELSEKDFHEIAPLTNFEAKDTNNNSQLFSAICAHYLNIEKEPREALIRKTENVARDLKKIKENIEAIDAEEKKLEERKQTRGHLNGEERYYRKRIRYYKEKNKRARDQIIDYVTDDLHAHSLRDCSSLRNIMSFPYQALMGDMPYQFSRGALFSHKDPYDFRELTQLSNKFYNLPVKAHKQIVQLFHENPSDFYDLAEQYLTTGIPGTQISKSGIEEIKEKTDNNHILNKRKDIISTITNHFQKQDYISVSNITPMQIEGIFHDICIELGISHSELDISSVNDKLNILNDNIKPFIYFEYYYFIFPVIRNLVAHGRLIDNDARHTAILLMLDLLPVCELAGNEKIPIIEAIKNIEDTININFESAIDWANNHLNTKIPEFYEFSEKYEGFKNLLEGDKFWIFMEDRAIKEEDSKIKDTETMKIAKKLKSSGIAEEQCLKFFKKTNKLQHKKDQAEKKREELRNKLLGKID